MANALSGLGEFAVLSGRFADSIAYYQESLSLFRALGDPRCIAVALTGLGGGLFRVGHLQESEDCMRETIQIFKELEDRAGVARSQFNLSRTFFIQGRYVDFTELFKVSNPIFLIRITNPKGYIQVQSLVARKLHVHSLRTTILEIAPSSLKIK